MHLHTFVSKFNCIFRHTPAFTRPFSNDQACPFMSLLLKSPSLPVLCSTHLFASRLTSLTGSGIFASSTKTRTLISMFSISCLSRNPISTISLILVFLNHPYKCQIATAINQMYPLRRPPQSNLSHYIFNNFFVHITPISQYIQ